jgi:hypothetical protein
MSFYIKLMFKILEIIHNKKYIKKMYYFLQKQASSKKEKIPYIYMSHCTVYIIYSPTKRETKSQYIQLLIHI